MSNTKVTNKEVKNNEDWLLLENQLCFPLYAASRLMTRLYQPLLEPLGITYTQYIVLMILWEDAPCTVSHICERALLNTNTLTPLLKRLESDGYITRNRSKTDERIVHISITQKGTDVKKECLNIPEQLLKSTKLTPEKFSQLKTLLDDFIDELK